MSLTLLNTKTPFPYNELASRIKLRGMERIKGHGWRDQHRIHTRLGVDPQQDSTKTHYHVMLKSADVIIVVNICKECDGWGTTAIADGHTYFRTAENTWYTFDKRGFEDSFYIRRDNLEHVENILQDQLERCQAEIAKGERRALPGTSIMLSRQCINEYREMILRQGTVTVMPGGMGTGYVITTRPSSRFQSWKPTWSEFFGFSSQIKLYAEAIECD